MQAGKTLLKFINIYLEKLTIILFIFMAIVVFSQVVARYVFGFSIFWAEEFARFCLIWISFLGAVIGVKYSEHTEIDFFVNLLPQKLKKIQRIVKDLLCILFLGYISYYSLLIIRFTLKTYSSALRVPIGLIQIVLPLSGVIMIIYFLIDFLQYI